MEEDERVVVVVEDSCVGETISEFHWPDSVVLETVSRHVLELSDQVGRQRILPEEHGACG